jgi:propane monooxygenase small subunit
LLLDDPQYAGENRAQLQEWLATWVPESISAARQLQPVWSQVSEKVVNFEDSLGRATARFGDLLDGLGLDYQKEL